MKEKKSGVLLMGFGGPDCIDAVGPFMHNLMGREPSPELIERVQRRYLTIGGASPLLDIAIKIAEKLETELSGEGCESIAIGMRYWQPFIGDSVDLLVQRGCERIVLVSLSPFESQVASGAYREAIEEAKTRHPGVEFVEAPLVSEMPELADFFAGSASVELTDIEPNDGAILVFTAHSLPESDLVDGDPYIEGLRRVADAVATRMGLPAGHENAGEKLFGEFRTYGSDEGERPWFLVYQSKGQKPGAWLEPDIDSLIDAAADSPVTALVVAAIGFMTDHMETLYDLDVVAADRALDNDLEWARAEVPNDHDMVVRGLAKLIAPLL